MSSAGSPGELRPGKSAPLSWPGTSTPARFPRSSLNWPRCPEGAEIIIDREDGTTAVFRVDRVVHYPKDELPTVEVYASTGRELRLITCGDWDDDTDSYRDNVVAYATLVGNG